jgi:hypothetical protein
VPNVAVAVAVRPKVADVLPAGMVRPPAGLNETPEGKPEAVNVIGAVVVPVHWTLTCIATEEPVSIVGETELNVKVKSAPVGVGVVTDALPLPPQPV